MQTVEAIKRYGIEVYEKRLQQARDWKGEHPEVVSAYSKKRREEHPEAVRAFNIESNKEVSRKDGKYYDKFLIYSHTGLQGEKHKIRDKHSYIWRKYKRIIAPGSQIHHEWIPGTSDYRGVAIVANQHMHGIIDVIEVLKGEITLLTEEDVRNA